MTVLDNIVAPFTGAWIEISIILTNCVNRYKSHPSRVRGLKYLHKTIMVKEPLRSHPSRVRGLKFP